MAGAAVALGLLLLRTQAAVLPARPAPGASRLAPTMVATSPGTSATGRRAYDLAAWRSGYGTCETESSYTAACDQLPADLVGTYYRNNPAKFQVGDTRVLHPFDGDGMVAAVTLDGQGRAHFRNRFVRTKGFVLEQRAGKALYPGEFANPRPFWGGGLERKNKANTNVIYWGGRLLALWEGGKPHLLDEVSLATSRESDLGGVLSPRAKFSAHPRVDAARRRLVGFGYEPNPVTGTKLSFYEFDSAFRPVDPERPRLDHTLPGFRLVHDFVVTKNYYLVTAAPTRVEGGVDILLGRRAAGEAISFDESQPAFFEVIRRDGSGSMRVPVDTHFNFHYANAYEDGEGRLVVDTVRVDRLFLGEPASATGTPVWDSLDWESSMSRSTLWRYTVDPVAKTHEREELLGRYCDFASVNPRVSGAEHRYVWAAVGAEAEGSSPLQGVCKLDTRTGEQQLWFPEAHQFLGEPVFAPREGAGPEAPEDDGYIVTFMHDGLRGKASLVVLSAADVGAGPVAVVPLETFLGHGLHGSFVPGVRPTQEDIERATRLMNMYARKSQEWNKVDGSFTGLGFKQLFQKGVDGR